MRDTIYRADAIEAVCGVVIDEFDVSPTKGYEVSEHALSALPSAEPTAEEVWTVAQKVFCSTLTYREAVDYLKEVEEQHERFNQQSRCD